MDYNYHYHYEEQGNYRDANTSRYCKHRLCLVLKIAFKLGKRAPSWNHWNIHSA